MEETQLLWDPDQRDPRGRLRILTGSQQAQSALVQFMVYEGLNVIGRDENCHIHIPVQSVSRRHAVIEIEGDSHVIRDCDSLNSTWRKKVFLKPHVRYDINDGDLFLFGEVACQYQVLPPAPQGSDSGSETGSESMLPQPGADAGAEGAESDRITEAGNSDAELTGDSMVVSPTPAHQRNRLPAQVAQPDVHVKESEDDDTPWKGSRSLFSRPCQDPSTSVCQTPSANIVPESDDEAENVSRSSAEPKRLHYDSDTDLEEDQHPGEESAEQSTEQPADGIDPRLLGDLSAAEEVASNEPGDGFVQENGDLPSQRPVTPPSADTSDLYALEPTQCFILNVSSSQDGTPAEENSITPGDPWTTRSPGEDATGTFNPQSPVSTKEPSQSDPVARTSETESVAEPPVSEAAETALPSHRGGSEPQEEGGPIPEDQESWANDETQLFCAEQRANGEVEEERAGNADRLPVPPSPDSPPGTEGGSVAEPPASPKPSAAADSGERGTISPEHGDVVDPATAEASPPGLGAEADTREPGTETSATGRRGRRRPQRRETRQRAETSPDGAEVAPETQSPSQQRTRARSRRKQECMQPCLQGTEMPTGPLPNGGDASAPPQMKTRRQTCQPSPALSLASLSESPAAPKRSETRQRAETTSAQTPARPRRGNCRQQTSPQPTASDHPRPLEESPQFAARGRAKRRTVASPQGVAEVPPETSSPSQQRTTGRSRRKQECTQPSSQEAEMAAVRVRSSGTASQPDSEKDDSAPPQMKTRRQTCQPSPASSLASVSESPTAPKVMFTGLVHEEGMDVIRQLGGEVVESVHDSTHLVANRIRRTVKFMCAVARGIPVVTSEWLKQSGRNRYFLSPRSFLLGDREQEQKFNFSLRDSIHKAKEQRLLQDYRIHVTPGVQPDPSQMATILQCCGATVLPKMPRANKEKTLVISCPGDLSKCKAALKANIPVVGVEFALTGILQQEVDLGKYRLEGAGDGDGDEDPHSQPQGKGRRLPSPETPVTGGKRKKR